MEKNGKFIVFNELLSEDYRSSDNNVRLTIGIICEYIQW